MSRKKPSPYNGLVLVDKEVGWTSHDVVAKSRGVLGTRKVGHAGTLDPPATGLLLLGVGNMTRLLRFLTALPKTYVGEVVLGSETDTLDDTGQVTATHDMGGVTLADVRAAAEDLTGEILQVPPMVSAIKIDGKRLHELAREGKEVEREARPITIHAFTVGEPVEEGVYPIEVTCSSGTYIRTLAADLGTALGGGAHLRNLRRTSAGSFDVADAHCIDEIDPDQHVLTPAEALRDLPTVVVDVPTAVDVGHGKPLERSRLGIPEGHDGPWAVESQDGVLLAVYGPHREGTVKPEVVLAT
ncbi:tRNA pseudouridine(55) synthase TruB [Acidimicrobiia bacterium EGI L10123]|uniref:tRNA pseudouridine(55) synthase TruB n=1 Tax=Salinilacustrithrix flava TaxID=2957203 RepID=UPI003D7C1561|nr:tRNA pseudouridine(55) synthase TruB [Acidimicrobiia bacterium EGI L10123]